MPRRQHCHNIPQPPIVPTRHAQFTVQHPASTCFYTFRGTRIFIFGLPSTFHAQHSTCTCSNTQFAGWHMPPHPSIKGFTIQNIFHIFTHVKHSPHGFTFTSQSIFVTASSHWTTHHLDYTPTHSHRLVHFASKSLWHNCGHHHPPSQPSITVQSPNLDSCIFGLLPITDSIHTQSTPRNHSLGSTKHCTTDPSQYHSSPQLAAANNTLQGRSFSNNMWHLQTCTHIPHNPFIVMLSIEPFATCCITHRFLGKHSHASFSAYQHN